uniref:Uncharacterized protein n=1 Tax=viral metagenome TaxID=1070528 RepID=A0A6M3L3U9_9ZZZZ
MTKEDIEAYVARIFDLVQAIEAFEDEVLTVIEANDPAAIMVTSEFFLSVRGMLSKYKSTIRAALPVVIQDGEQTQISVPATTRREIAEILAKYKDAKDRESEGGDDDLPN